MDTQSETLKYLFLTFAEEDVLDLNGASCLPIPTFLIHSFLLPYRNRLMIVDAEVVFNTEVRKLLCPTIYYVLLTHPCRRFYLLFCVTFQAHPLPIFNPSITPAFMKYS